MLDRRISRLGGLGILACAALASSGCLHRAEPPAVPIVQPTRVSESIVGAVVAVPLTALAPAIDTAVPKVIHSFQDFGGGTGHVGGMNLEYYFKRGPIQLRASGDVITLTTHLRYYLRLRIGLPFFGATAYYSCGFFGDHQSLRDMEAVITLRVRGVKPDWSPNLEWSVESVRPGARRCNVHVLLQKVDLTNFVTRHLESKLQENLGTLSDSLRREVNLRDRAAVAWTRLFRAIPVGNDLWLRFNPVGFSTAPVSSVSGTVLFGLRFSGYPELIASRAAPTGPNPPLLPRPASSTMSDRFRVVLPVEVGYRFASREVSAALRSATGGMRYPPVGGSHITVTGATLYGYGSSAVLRVEARKSGFFGGRLQFYLMGTPTLDSRTDVLSFPDLRLSFHSRRLLTRFAVWLDQRSLEEDLRYRVRFDLSSQVASARSRLQAALNERAGDLALAGSVARVTLLGIRTDPGHHRFDAVLLAKGSLSATVLR